MTREKKFEDYCDSDECDSYFSGDNYYEKEVLDEMNNQFEEAHLKNSYKDVMIEDYTTKELDDDDGSGSSSSDGSSSGSDWVGNESTHLDALDNKIQLIKNDELC